MTDGSILHWKDAIRMRKTSLKSRLRSVLLAMACAILILWTLFYLITSNVMENSNQAVMSQVSQQVMSVVETELLSLEHIAFTLGQSAQVKAFVQEADSLAYHEKSGQISTLLNTLIPQSSFVGNLLIYNQEGVYSHFSGSLGNTAAARIGYDLEKKELPQHLYLALEGTYFVGYASGIYEENRQIGMIVLLIEEERLITFFSQYSEMNNIKIALVADGKVLVSSDGALAGISVDDLLKGKGDFLRRKIGVTPFEVVVGNDGSYADTMIREFAVAVAATALIFVLILFLFLALWNRSFFRPMLQVMRGVESLGSEQELQALPSTGEESFDRLVEQINAMLIRLDEKNRELLHARLGLQNAQIERQKALIISLKKQINAHFTINVLNSIKLLAEKQEMEKTGEMCDGLSYLLRYANAGDEFIGGMEEFFILEKYISIMSIRYRDRFQSDFDVDDRLDNVLIPRMLIQPILENAILHGFKKMNSGGYLHVHAAQKDNRVVVRVSDNGCGMEESALQELRTRLADAHTHTLDEQGLEHIALLNIQKRLRAYYGAEYGLTVDSTPGIGTTVTLILPTSGI